MSKARYRTAYACALAGATSMCLARDARAAEAEPIAATMQCEHASEPGRVRCSVEVRADASTSIAWADVVILELPDFASALKGRLAPGEATARDEQSFKWAFGLVARRGGQGEVRARVRVVACEGRRCVPMTTEVRAKISVG